MQTCGVDYAAAFSCLVVVREAEAGSPSSAPAHPRLVSPKLTQVGTNPTTLHALLGLLPILWSTGTGSELMRGIAVPMIAGIFSWTVLTLIVIPAVYGLVKGWRLRRMVAAPVAAASDHRPFGSRPAE
jgi:Cu(I)/Ag(I) efflux system membrane protein CusA/SilA